MFAGAGQFENQIIAGAVAAGAVRAAFGFRPINFRWLIVSNRCDTTAFPVVVQLPQCGFEIVILPRTRQGTVKLGDKMAAVALH